MVSLAELRRELVGLPSFEGLATCLQDRPAQVRVAPLPSAGRTPIVAALACVQRAPLLYLLSSADLALRAAEDLRQWLGPEAVLLYPASDALPYEHMSPGAPVIAGRLRVIQRLAAFDASQPTAPLVIVAPVKALLQPTLTPTELARAMLALQRGQQINQDELLHRLIRLGYRHAPTVEEPGEVTRRGDLVDVWPPADEYPLRIEFFGDEIDNLRRFEVATQRSTARVTSVLLGPPHEIPLWRRDEALTRIRALTLDQLRRESRLEWEAALERLEHGDRFEGRAFFAPFFRQFEHEVSGSLLAHLPVGSAVLFSEAQFLRRHALDLHEHAENQRARLLEAAELPSAFPRPYLLWHELFPAELALPDEPGEALPAAVSIPPTWPGLTLVDLSNNDADAPGSVTPSLAPPLFQPAELFGGQFRRLVDDLVARLQRGERVVAVTGQAARLYELVEERLPSSGFQVIHGALEAGWRLNEVNLTLYTDAEIFGVRQRRPLSERRKSLRGVDERAAFVRGLKTGDYVVHIEHGIALYDGLIRRTVGEIEREYLVLRYAAGDKIYVPVDQVDRVTRYVGAGDGTPTLTRLGTQDWERAKRKARAAVQDLAQDLLNLYAKRRLSQGHHFSPDNEWQHELEAAFPFLETDDQLQAISDVKADMEQSVPMDRLICGDVGFGKTEVALRAAFKAIQDGKQVAVLVPTTVLAQQHFDTFTRRMAAFPVMVEMLSRFRSPKAQDQIVQALARGQVDVVIGTHRLLSKDVSFKDLGLVVVDEEQRFGVRHKERLKQLRAQVDVLTLTATPIPRTLHMAMAGIRDLSVIDTPPEERVPIKTYVLPYDEALIREAILREVEREGQIYFVHNRVHSIYHVANRIRYLVPEVRIGVGHGQLQERELERVMLDFFEGRHDVLVCTTIIESGLDVPNANTIIIDDATNYGLAQLYQLRGRVGRSANRAYAYLLYKQDKPMTAEAQARLEAIQEANELGAGFRVAMRDLEIRGAGNLLGAEQSGHIAAVGFDLYSRLLEQAVKQLKASVDQPQPPLAPDQPDTPAASAERDRARMADAVSKLVISEKILVAPLVTLDLPLTAYLPTDYIADDQVRLGVYQRMVAAQTLADVKELRTELQDRFGEPPRPALHLLTWLQIKALALQAGVSSVITSGDEFIIRLPILEPTARERLRRRYGRDPGVKIGPQFVRLDRRRLNNDWSDKIMGVLEVMAG
ncbi:transcription-repair coupling factor [Candidatus Chloroploca sp. M-50]|uniref:Transcription-repair-coupling factor n=1 Tax=Candidatus Chloroploca mongolica TaxID=2528176 RepID=A0ABS4DAH0_9CHLR|nr:transcription-repair coupling factor [Candidatus Chloroploca mongolica]MBP1466432.1 transcription-repair coupling factor [Candidatus Chloroploca mongolica]